jgi:hypothetical protein
MRLISSYGLHCRRSVRTHEKTNEDIVCRVSSHILGLKLTYLLFRWGPGKDAMNSVHTDDVAGSLWAAALWIASLGRKAADSLAGEEIIFHNDKRHVTEVNGMPPYDKKLIAPMFNIVSVTFEFYWSNKI